MQFRIADTFTASLARLAGDEQKAVKTTAFDLQLDPLRPGLQIHKIEGARDRNFWSIRASRDIRIIVHRTENSLMLCYVDHHDDAYRWAGRRKLETHPKTGAAQLVEVRETVEEVAVPVYVPVVQEAQTKRLPFAGLPDEQLLSYGVPVEWLPDIHAADEDGISRPCQPPSERSCRSAAGTSHRWDAASSRPGPCGHRPVRPPGRAATLQDYA